MNVCFNRIVRIIYDNVASRGAVGRTHTIVSLQTRIRRKDGTKNFGGFVYVLDGLLRRDFVLWFLCARLISVSLFSGYHAEGYHAPPIPHGLSRLGLSRPYHHCTAITRVYISRLSRRSLVLLLGYHNRAITLHHTRKSGYHTRHSSQFVVYRSPAITPRVFFHLHHHRGATRTNLLHTIAWIERAGRASLSAHAEN